MEQNKTSKYFKYAIGEIVLVVIGILIALQINNWNENRKGKQFENKILNEIRTSLQKDLKRTKDILESRAEVRSEAIYNLLKYLNSDALPNDSILKREISITRLGIVFSFDKGPYESLKSMGLDKISNDSLRSKLVRFYEVSLPLSKEFMNFNKDKDDIRRDAFYDKISKYTYAQNKKGQWYVQTQFDFTTIATNVDFMKLMELEGDEASNIIYRLRNVIEESEEMITALNTELKHSF